MSKTNLTFHSYLEDLSPNLSPARREALIFPPTLVGKGGLGVPSGDRGERGLGFSWIFPHDVKSQQN